MISYEKELSLAKKVALEAGRLLENKLKENHDVSLKYDGTIVTEVDKEVSAIIYNQLHKAFPEYGMLDEERTTDDTRKKNSHCWVVDPLDGTSDFIKKGEQFGIMIGLMRDYKPVMGVVYQPLQMRMAFASEESGAYLQKTNLEPDGKIAGSPKQISASNKKLIDLVVSRQRISSELESLIGKIDPSRIMLMPTSFKILEVAVGNYNAFINLPSNQMNLWDLCAHQIILYEAGGKMTDFNGDPIDYSGIMVADKGVLTTNGQIHHKLIKITSDYLKERDNYEK